MYADNGKTKPLVWYMGTVWKCTKIHTVMFIKQSIIPQYGVHETVTIWCFQE